MNSIEYIKLEIEKLYKNSPFIHISLNRTHPRVNVERSPARIIGIYNNIFQVEECEAGKTSARHTIQYSDVLIGQVKIDELDYVPKVSISNKK